VRAPHDAVAAHGDDEMIRVRRDELLRAREQCSISDIEIDQGADCSGVPFGGAADFHGRA